MDNNINIFFTEKDNDNNDNNDNINVNDFIINDSNERELLINVSCMILDVPGFKWKEKNNCVKLTTTSDFKTNFSINFSLVMLPLTYS